MHKDIEFIKYCVSKAEGWDKDSDFEGEYIIAPSGLAWDSSDGNDLTNDDWEKTYFPFLLSRTCDALGIYVEKTAFGWMHCGANRGGFYTTADEARIAAIKEYMEDKE